MPTAALPEQFTDKAKALALTLPEEVRQDFIRLGKTLQAQSGRWGLFVLQFEHFRLRERIADAIEQLAPASVRVTADDTAHADWPALEAALADSAPSAGLIQLFGLERWLDPSAPPQAAEARLRAWNIRREAFAREVPVPLLCWMLPEQIRLLATFAPDLWSWRGGVLRFLDAATPLPSAPLHPQPARWWLSGVDNRTMEQRHARMHELQNRLAQPELAQDPALLASMAGELAELCQSVGDLDRALSLRTQTELPAWERLGDVRSQAITQGRIADILQARGQFNEALRIHQHEQLPVYERLGDERSKAITQGRIADILEARGQLDEALHIRQHEELPVYERLGDVHSKAVTLGQIADILQDRGQLDEALRIRQHEELPVYERLGDLRAKAITLGKIADSLQARGQPDEALRIRQNEQLPVFERLGDVRSKAITLGRIADILQARGQLDEALRIREHEELPVFERLGEVRAKAVTQGQIADILQARGQLDEALALLEEELATMVLLNDIGGEAHALFSIARLKLKQRPFSGEQERSGLFDQLARAFSLVVQLRRPDAVFVIGMLLAKELASDGRQEQALAVLAQIEALLPGTHMQDSLADTARLRAQLQAGEMGPGPA